jgi:asparagine synthase (glutamine-hydrolysing)
MCGISGFVTSRNVSITQLKQMNDAMVHRGPDDSGEEIFSFCEKLNIGLGQRRLSILDLTPNGHQPFHSNDDQVIVVFNGEIYNFRKLKEEISEYQYISTCDTEVIVAAYQKWGELFVDHIDGMFAIALFDRAQHKLILVRDRVGKKPLYYAWNGQDFIFASTLKPIMEYPSFERRIDQQVLPRFLLNGYIAGEDCILDGVHKVAPGQMLIFNGISIEKRIYWSMIDRYKENEKHQLDRYDQAKSVLKKKLVESVEARMVADVPVGAFLSGGYDSSLVVAVAQSLSSRPIKTFSIGFEDKEYNEAPFAESVANYLRTDHTSHYVTEKEMLELVASIPQYYDEPFADSSQIPSMLVAKIAKEQVSVVLTGDGGDEFYCGYRMYEKLAAAQLLEPAARILRVFVKGSLREKMPFSVQAILNNENKKYQTQFGREYYLNSIRQMLPCEDIEIPYDESDIPIKEWQIRRMLLDGTKYLPDNGLCKVDRATMRYSLEARNPLLDVSMIETSFNVPHKFKYYKKDKKHILKDICYDYIPMELLDRPKKGFMPPLSKWLRGALKEDLQKVTSVPYLKEQGIFDPEFTFQFVKEFIDTGDRGGFTGHNPSQLVWPLYMFQKWYQYYIE